MILYLVLWRLYFINNTIVGCIYAIILIVLYFKEIKILYKNFIILETNLPHPKKPKNISDNKLITIFNTLPLNVILTICNLFSKNILTKKMISQLLSKKNSLIMQIYDFLKIIEAQA